MSYPKNAATPKAVTVGSVIQISDGAVQTSGCSVRVDLDGGGWGAGSGSLSYDTTSGSVSYAPTQAETNGDVLRIAVYKASCIGCSTTVLMDLQSADNNTILANGTYGLSALKTHGDSAWITATSVTVSDKTGFKLASDGLDAVTTWTVDITGSMSGNSTHDAAAVKTAIEAAGSSIAQILEDTGTTIPATITTAQGTLTKLEDTLEDDAGTYRFTENALEEAPSGTGGDATASNQTSILTALTDIKGTGFVKDTDSLVDLAHTGADGDTLEDISDEIAAITVTIDQDDIDSIVSGLISGGMPSADAVEQILAVVAGNMTFNSSTGVVSFKDMSDGTTERATYTVASDSVGRTSASVS